MTATRSGLAAGDVVTLQLDDDELHGQRVTIAAVQVHGGEEFVTVLHPEAHDDDWEDGDPWLTVRADQVLPVRAS